MAYLEITKNGKTVRRERVPDERAKAGFTVRLSGHEPIRMKLGETTRAGDYELRVIADATDPDDSKSSDQSASPGKRVPHLAGYELDKRLGEGGMGVVWKGIQQSTHRTVAVKFLGRRAFGSDRSRKRFEREVHLSAKLEHPAIVRVYDSGLVHGVYFYAMELIDGAPLDQYAEQNKLTRNATLQLFKALCDAVQYAHDRGVIHRDLKPSNVLVTKDGQPHVLDFGLAKSLIEEADETNHHLTMSLEGEAAGTPAYMSPEQAAGRHAQTDGRTDVWSIGVMLYRLLVGHPPHDLSGTRFDVTKRIVEEEIRSPKSLGVNINADLEGLLRKAVARNPEDRYTTVGEFAQDIENFLEGRPLIARKATFIYLLRKRVARHRMSIAACTALLAVAAAIVIGLLPGGWLRPRIQTTRILVPATNPVTLADAAALAAKCDQRINQVQTLDPSDGIAEKVSQVKAISFTAKQLLDQKHLAEAASQYQAAITLCDHIAAQDAQRQKDAINHGKDHPDIGISDADRAESIVAIKALQPFCGAYNVTVNDPRHVGSTWPSTALCRIRYGGLLFTFQLNEPYRGYSEMSILHYDVKQKEIVGVINFRGHGFSDVKVNLLPNDLELIIGRRDDHLILKSDRSIRCQYTDASGKLRRVFDATPGWPEITVWPGESDFALSPPPPKPALPPVDPLADSVLPLPGNDPKEAHASMYVLRLDAAVVIHDWEIATQILQILQSQFADTRVYSDQRATLTAWAREISNADLAVGESRAKSITSQPTAQP